jgi:hypothetical protein
LVGNIISILVLVLLGGIFIKTLSTNKPEIKKSSSPRSNPSQTKHKAKTRFSDVDLDSSDGFADFFENLGSTSHGSNHGDSDRHGGFGDFFGGGDGDMGGFD